jgi:hypothetical protein
VVPHHRCSDHEEGLSVRVGAKQRKEEKEREKERMSVMRRTGGVIVKQLR